VRVAIRDIALEPHRGVTHNAAMTDSKRSTYVVEVEVATRFLDEQSSPDENRFVFAYSVTIRNRGEIPAKLMARHWVITDANGKVQEVRGSGVIGEQPWMRPGEDFNYTSGAVLETAIGTMRGSYQMLADDGTRFDAAIPEFTLSIPRTLH
jgi:ApaG protein